MPENNAAGVATERDEGIGLDGSRHDGDGHTWEEPPTPVLAGGGLLEAADPSGGAGLIPRPWLVASVLVGLVSAGVFSNSLRNGYAFDDLHIILRNPVIHGFDLSGILLGPYWQEALEAYRPMTLLSFALEWQLAGDSPGVFHAFNVLLHAVVTVAALLLVLRLGAPLLAAVVGGLVFAVHPVHVEAVANLVGRAELLAALFVLVGCHLHISRSVGFGWRVAGTSASYALALGSKEIAVTLPALLVLLELVSRPCAGLPVRRRVRELGFQLAALAALLVVFLQIRSYVLGSSFGVSRSPYLTYLDTLDRLATAARLVPEYVRLLVWPRHLSADWGPATIHTATWSDPLAWFGVGLVLLAAALSIWAWRSSRWVAVGLAWCAVVIAPVSHVFFIGSVMLAERTLYLPSVALLMLAPPAVAAVARSRPALMRAATVGLAALLVLGTVHTWRRTPVWESTHTVRDSLIRDNPETGRAQWWVGLQYAERGRLEEAEPYFARAYELYQRSAFFLNYQYSLLLLQLERPTDARTILASTARASPRAEKVRYLLAHSYISEGNFREALKTVENAREYFGEEAQETVPYTHAAALAYDGLGQFDLAMAERVASIRADSLQYFHWLHLARLHELTGDDANAAEARRRGIAVAPVAARDSLAALPRLPLDHPHVLGPPLRMMRSAPLVALGVPSPVELP